MYKSRVSKLFLDSRYTLPDGSFEVPGDALELHPDSRCWLGEFTCVASWNTIDATNRELVVIENAVPRTVYIPMGVHDLSSLQTALQSSLNEDVPPAIGGYTVTLVSTANGGSNFRSFLVMAQDGVFKIPPATNRRAMGTMRSRRLRSEGGTDFQNPSQGLTLKAPNWRSEALRHWIIGVMSRMVSRFIWLMTASPINWHPNRRTLSTKN